MEEGEKMDKVKKLTDINNIKEIHYALLPKEFIDDLPELYEIFSKYSKERKFYLSTGNAASWYLIIHIGEKADIEDLIKLYGKLSVFPYLNEPVVISKENDIKVLK